MCVLALRQEFVKNTPKKSLFNSLASILHQNVQKSKKMPKTPSKNKGKRAREGSSTSDQDGDPVVLKILEWISALESKEEANLWRLNNMQAQLDQERVNTCEEDQMRSEDELIRQSIHPSIKNVSTLQQ